MTKRNNTVHGYCRYLLILLISTVAIITTVVYVTAIVTTTHTVFRMYI